MTMKIKERLSAAALSALFLSALISAKTFPALPKMLPTAISAMGAVLSAVLFIRTFFVKYEEDKAAAEMSEEEQAEEKCRMIKTAVCIAIMLIYVGLIKIIGFYVISFIYINVFAYYVDTVKQKLWLYPVVACGVLAVIYGIFSLFLKVSLPSGVLF